MTITPILPVKITIGYSELGTDLKGLVITDETAGEIFWHRAWRTLWDLAFAREKADAIGYAKTDFIVTFADGSEYKGRLDIKHPWRDSEPGGCDCDVSGHILDHLLFYAGRLDDHELPSHFTPESCRAFLADERIKPEVFARQIDGYALTDARIREVLASTGRLVDITA